MSEYDNPVGMDIERMIESITDSGGGVNSSWEGDHIHHAAYSNNGNRHFFWDEYPDGSIRNVHTD